MSSGIIVARLIRANSAAPPQTRARIMTQYGLHSGQQDLQGGGRDGKQTTAIKKMKRERKKKRNGEKGGGFNRAQDDQLVASDLRARVQVLDEEDGDAIRKFIGEAHGAVNKGPGFYVGSDQVCRYG